MAQIIDLGKLRFYWAGEYNSSTVYEVNDVVKYGGNVYVYTNTLSEANHLPTDTDYWALMISGLKFEGEYNDATTYQVGDGVAYGGIVYICVADTTGNEPPNATYWSQFADGIQYEGSYAGGTAYQTNDVVTYGGKAYIAKQDTSGNVPTNTTYWDKLVDGVRGMGNYASGTQYLPGDIVSYGGNVYLNILTSTGNIPTNTTYWSLMASGIKYIGEYSSITAYKINELVKYGPKLYVAKQATTGNLPTDSTYWDALVDGIGASGVYNNATAYVPGSVVAYGANLYICTDESTGNIPTDTDYWDLFIPSVASVGSYDNGDTYYIGDIVRYGANLYICKLQSTGNIPTNATYFDLFIASIKSAGTYSSGTTYYIGDIVKYGANLYVCKLESTGNLPTNTTYFDTFVNSLQNAGTWSSGTTYYLGDVVAYGPNRYVALRETVGDAPDESASDWEILTEGLNIRGNWTTATQYYLNDVVNRGGSTYICILKHSSGGSFATDLAASKWTKYNSGIRWRGEWQPSTAYLVDDLVYNGVSTYIAIADFTSDSVDFDNDTNWDLLSLGADTLPSQLNNSGKFLSTNGTVAVWASSGTLDSLTVNEDLEVQGDLLQHGDINVTYRSVDVTNVIKTNNVATITTDGPHYFDSGDTVVVSGVDVYPADDFDGTFNIATTPTATTFTYTKAGANVGSTVINSGTANVIGDVTVTGTTTLSADLTVSSDAHVIGDLYIGANAAAKETSLGLTDTIAVGVGNTDAFVQFSIHNASSGANASSDFLAYSDNGTNDNGWIDMGITSSQFDDATYGITGPNDGYIFMSAPAPTTASITNKELTDNVATLTTSAAHGYSSGDTVVVTGVDATFNGSYTLSAVTTNTFSYSKTASNVASAAVSPEGAANRYTGEGNLVLATDSSGSANKIIFAAGGLDSGNEQMSITPDQNVHIEIDTASSNATSGALTVVGGVGVSGALSAEELVRIEGVLYVGDGAEAWETAAGLTSAKAVFNKSDTTAQNSFAQISWRNADPTSSTDIIAYMDNGDDTYGWMGLGIAGSTFDDATYGITGPGDGYIFHNAINADYAGNMVFATGEEGSENKIVFAAGGFSSGTTQMEITPGVNVHIEIPTPSTSPTTGALTVVGGVGIQGDLNIQGNVDIEGTIVFGGGGTTVSAANLSVTDPFVFVGAANQADILDLGFIVEHTVNVAAITATVTNKALTNNVATLTTAADHTYRVGDVVVVSGVDGTFDGTYAITSVPTSTTFTYAKTAANVASQADTGGTDVQKRRVFDGIVRDTTDNVVKFFQNLVVKPTTTVDFSEAGITYADVKLGDLDAETLDVTGNVTIGTDKLAVNTTSGAVTVANTFAVTQGSTFTGGFVSNATSNVNAALNITGLATFTGGISSSGNTVITGVLDVQEIREEVVDRNVGTVTANVFTADYSIGNIFYIATAPGANYTVNLTNAPTDNGKTISITLVQTQGSTGYYPNAFQVAGVQTTGGTNGIKWVGAAAPTPTSSAGRLDIWSFTLIRRGSAWEVLGSSVLNFG